MDGTWGKFEDYKDQMENLEQFMKRFREIYSEYTDIPERKLKKLLRRDLYLDSDKCLDWKIIHSLW